MRIVVVSDLETTGGAAIAASRLADGLHQSGHQVTRIVSKPDLQTHSWTTVTSGFFLVGRAAFRMQISDVWGPISRRICGAILSRMLARLRPDVINVHNLHGAFALGMSPGLLRVCASRAPTVWTLHDMWSFTGRCAYSHDCRKFLAGCDETCPTPTEHPSLAPRQISGAWRRRRQLLAGLPGLVAVTPSRWLAQEAKAGLWASHQVEVIPYGLPLDVYRPLSQAVAREALGIEGDGPILLTAAEDLTDRRKGGSLLVEALWQMKEKPLTLVTLGHGHLEVSAENTHIYRLGYVDHERTRVLAYNAADIFLHPAPVDNLPNVVMEAIACGTPVVGFPIGGVRDMVRPGQTGWLADEVTPEALAAATDRAIQDLNAGDDMRLSCRGVAEAEYGLDLQVDRYVKLFQSLGVSG